VKGIVLHQTDPSKSGEGHGLVWGSVLWPSGVSLSKYLFFLTQKAAGGIMKQRRILDMGCGTGIVGLTMAKLNEDAKVILSDSETALWPLLRKNIQENIGDNDRITISGLDWRDPTTFLPPEDIDLILAADVLYSGMDKLFARALASHLTLENEAFVACPFRKDSPLKGWFVSCQRLGLKLTRLEDVDGHAVGAHWGVDPHKIFGNSQFVPITEQNLERITVAPTFGAGNDQSIQIFRVKRVSGTPEEAIQIRRVSRI
jgi:predicted nicotinamide N-methyase